MSANACKLLIKGQVQGVGFRPVVYNLAIKLGLTGWVKNTSLGVEIVISAPDPEYFLGRLHHNLPPLARIESITKESFSQEITHSEFKIIESNCSTNNSTPIPPDSRICDECLNDIFDPSSRFYLYPFTSCSNCGPRYTLIQDLPYDRYKTSMSKFRFCTECDRDYNDPSNRRYHAETSSCPQCGPKFEIDLNQVAKYIKQGKIIALKTIGGYMLIADPTQDEVVARLRQAKNRKSKPFALMALNTESIKKYYAKVSQKEEQLLISPPSPIVILNKQVNNLSTRIAPNLSYLGFMLPPSGIYYLLFYFLLGEPKDKSWIKAAHNIALLVTSGNPPHSSIIATDHDAKLKLSEIADYVISHNREIIMPCDDSLISVVSGYQIQHRRARGYAPTPFKLNEDLPEVLALGTHFKNTICFIRQDNAYLSQYIGEMDNPATINYFQNIINHYRDIYDFKPQLVISDLHPDFFVNQFAQNMEIESIQLQHHHAHLCAAIVTSLSDPRFNPNDKVLGCILDGYGYGLDGEALGGELILFNSNQLTFDTVSQLPEFTLPGGDIAEQEPWRIALALCHHYNLEIPQHLAQQINSNKLIKLIESGYFAKTTSLGRFISGIAALLNISLVNDYEAHCALIMEGMALEPCIDYSAIELNENAKPDFNKLTNKIYQIGVKEGNITKALNIFYGSLAEIIYRWIIHHASSATSNQVVVGGGCWQNRQLLELITKKFQENSRIKLITPSQLLLNDESISLGQGWYAAKKLKKLKFNSGR